MATFADGLAVRVAIPEAVERSSNASSTACSSSPSAQMAQRDRRLRRRPGIARRGRRRRRPSPRCRSSPTSTGPGRPHRHGPQHRRRALPPRARGAGVVPGVTSDFGSWIPTSRAHRAPIYDLQSSGPRSALRTTESYASGVRSAVGQKRRRLALPGGLLVGVGDPEEASARSRRGRRTRCPPAARSRSPQGSVMSG